MSSDIKRIKICIHIVEMNVSNNGVDCKSLRSYIGKNTKDKKKHPADICTVLTDRTLNLLSITTPSMVKYFMVIYFMII